MTLEGSLLSCCRSVALTVPAYIAADLISSSCPDAAKGLRSLDYPPVAAVSVAYPMSSLRQDRLDAAGALPGVLLPSTASICMAALEHGGIAVERVGCWHLAWCIALLASWGACQPLSMVCEDCAPPSVTEAAITLAQADIAVMEAHTPLQAAMGHAPLGAKGKTSVPGHNSPDMGASKSDHHSSDLIA